MKVRICKRKHVVSGPGLCMDCKRMRDREWAMANKKPVLTEAEREANRKKARRYYAKSMKDPQWRKRRSAQSSANLSRKLKESPEAKEARRKIVSERWKAVKADPVKHAAEKAKATANRKKRRQREIEQNAAAVASAVKLRAKAEAIVRDERMGIIRRAAA